MLDPDILREKPQEVRRMLEKRSVEFDIDGLLAANEARLKDMASCDAIRHERNKIGKMISEAKKSNKDPADLFKKMSEMSEQITKAEEASAESGKKYRRLAFAMPNMLDETVPEGPDESANKLVRKWGSEDIGFEPKNHLDVAAFSNTIDMERAAKTAGARFYYLRDGLVRLNQAIISYSLDFLSTRGYSLVQPPYMINRAAMEGAVIAKHVIYIEDESPCTHLWAGIHASISYVLAETLPMSPVQSNMTL